jgi:hypothetical protein
MIYYGQNGLTALYVGSNAISLGYLGSNVVWSPLTGNFWYDITSFSGCAYVTINSSSNITNGLSWGNNVYSNILSGSHNYNYCYLSTFTGSATPAPNYFSNPFNIDTLLYPSTDLSGPNWNRGPSATRIGTTTAPDGSQNAVIYRSSQVANCYVSQGYGAYWLPNTTYTFTVWARLINDGGQPNNLGNIFSITKNVFNDRVILSANGIIDNTWKKFSISFTTGPTNGGSYTTCFLFDTWQSNQQVALWGASMTY